METITKTQLNTIKVIIAKRDKLPAKDIQQVDVVNFIADVRSEYNKKQSKRLQESKGDAIVGDFKPFSFMDTVKHITNLNY